MLPKDELENLYYAKTKLFDDTILNSIEHKTSTFARQGISHYSNGNVEVIIPCPFKDLPS